MVRIRDHAYLIPNSSLHQCSQDNEILGSLCTKFTSIFSWVGDIAWTPRRTKKRRRNVRQSNADFLGVLQSFHFILHIIIINIISTAACNWRGWCGGNGTNIQTHRSIRIPMFFCLLLFFHELRLACGFLLENYSRGHIWLLLLNIIIIIPFSSSLLLLHGCHKTAKTVWCVCFNDK